MKMADYTIQLRSLFEKDRFGHQYFTRAEVESWFEDYELSDYLTEEQIRKFEEDVKNNNILIKNIF